MSKRGVVEILSDIEVAISRINKYIRNLNYDQFLKVILTGDPGYINQFFLESVLF